MAEDERLYHVVFTGTIVVQVRAEDATLAEQYARMDVAEVVANGDLVRREVWIGGGDVTSATVILSDQAPLVTAAPLFGGRG